MGFLKATNSLVNAGTSFSPDTAPLIVSMPNMSVAKLSRISPVSFLRASLQNMKYTVPMSASTGVNELGFKSCTKKLSA